MKPLVYLAGPYSSPDPVENTHATIMLATELVEAGRVTPIVPHLSLAWHLVTPRPIGFWYAYDLEVLARCDYILRMPGASTGADSEVKEAERLAIPVAYDLPELYALVDAEECAEFGCHE
jgi:hypothetical protein